MLGNLNKRKPSKRKASSAAQAAHSVELPAGGVVYDVIDEIVKSRKDVKKTGNKISPRTRLYFKNRIENPGKPKRQAAIEAGYSASTACNANLLEKRFPDLAKTIEAAMVVSGATVDKSLATLVSIRDCGQDSDRIAAVKVITDITGQKMPEVSVSRIKSDDQMLDAILLKMSS